MGISRLRSILYGSARTLGDVEAVEKSVETGSPTPIIRRVARIAAGRLTGRLLGVLFR